MDEIDFSDHCREPDDLNYLDTPRSRCHLLAGWTIGQETCALWERLSTLCQTDTEEPGLGRCR